MDMINKVKKAEKAMFDRYGVEVEFATTLAGGVPKNPEIIAGWVNSQNDKITEAEKAKIAEAEIEAMGAITEEKATKSWMGFRIDEKGPYMGGYQVKAMFKEIAKTLGLNLAEKKAGFKHCMQTGVHISPERIYFGTDKVSGVEEQVTHPQTPQGPVSAIKRFDVMNPGTKIQFEVKLLRSGSVKEDHLVQILALAQHAALGANRAQGHGKFKVTKLEKVE